MSCYKSTIKHYAWPRCSCVPNQNLPAARAFPLLLDVFMRPIREAQSRGITSRCSVQLMCSTSGDALEGVTFGRGLTNTSSTTTPCSTSPLLWCITIRTLQFCKRLACLLKEWMQQCKICAHTGTSRLWSQLPWVTKSMPFITWAKSSKVGQAFKCTYMCTYVTFKQVHYAFKATCPDGWGGYRLSLRAVGFRGMVHKRECHACTWKAGDALASHTKWRKP